MRFRSRYQAYFWESYLTMADPQLNPFTALASIGAPALLTNATALLILSTSNRLARVVDQARALTAELESPNALSDHESSWAMRELDAAQLRMVMLIRALRSYYFAIGGFAVASLLAIIGAIASPMMPERGATALEILTIVAGIVAVCGVVDGAQLLVRETRTTVAILTERAQRVQTNFINKKMALEEKKV